MNPINKFQGVPAPSRRKRTEREIAAGARMQQLHLALADHGGSFVKTAQALGLNVESARVSYRRWRKKQTARNALIHSITSLTVKDPLLL